MTFAITNLHHPHKKSLIYTDSVKYVLTVSHVVTRNYFNRRTQLSVALVDKFEN